MRQGHDPSVGDSCGALERLRTSRSRMPPPSFPHEGQPRPRYSTVPVRFSAMSVDASLKLYLYKAYDVTNVGRSRVLFSRHQHRVISTCTDTISVPYSIIRISHASLSTQCRYLLTFARMKKILRNHTNYALQCASCITTKNKHNPENSNDAVFRHNTRSR